MEAFTLGQDFNVAVVLHSLIKESTRDNIKASGSTNVQDALS